CCGLRPCACDPPYRRPLSSSARDSTLKDAMAWPREAEPGEGTPGSGVESGLDNPSLLLDAIASTGNDDKGVVMAQRRADTVDAADIGASAMKKAIWRLGPFLGLLYLIAYIDR